MVHDQHFQCHKTCEKLSPPGQHLRSRSNAPDSARYFRARFCWRGHKLTDISSCFQEFLTVKWRIPAFKFRVVPNFPDCMGVLCKSIVYIHYTRMYTVYIHYTSCMYAGSHGSTTLRVIGEGFEVSWQTYVCKRLCFCKWGRGTGYFMKIN